MPFSIVLRNSNASGSFPSLRSLARGEIAINTYDGRIYLKKVRGRSESLVTIGGIDNLDGAKNYLLYTNESGSITSSIVYQSGSFIGFRKTNNLNSAIDVSGSVTITGSLNITENSSVSGSFNVGGNTIFSGSLNTFLGNVNINGNLNASLPPSILSASFITRSYFSGYEDAIIENRILVDCSDNKFFTWTASFTTIGYAYTASYITASTINFAASSSGVLTLPSGGQKGDIYLAGVGSDEGDGVGGFPVFPSGWITINSSLGGASEYQTTAYYIQTSSVVPSNPTITGISVSSCGFALLLRNIDHNNVTASFSASVATGASGMPDPPAISASRANSLVVAIGYLDDDSITPVTAPTNFTMSAAISSSTLGQTVMAATLITSSAVVNPGAFGGAGTDDYVALSLAFFSPTGSATLPTTVAFTNFPISQSYEMTHIVYTQNTGSPIWTSSLNSYTVTWPYNRIPTASLSQSSVYKFTTIDGGTNIYGQDITKNSSDVPSEIGANGNIITTSQGTTSTTYTNLATVGPSTSVIIGPSGRAMVTLTGVLSNNTAGAQAYMSFAASGVAASDSASISTPSGSLANIRYQQSATFWVTGLTTGSNTFTAQYKRNLAGTATFENRQIIVVPV